jgi:hypothetical protein
VSCAPSGDEGPISYIEIKKTKKKLIETKANNPKTTEPKKIEIKIKKHNPEAELDRYCERLRH